MKGYIRYILIFLPIVGLLFQTGCAEDKQMPGNLIGGEKPSVETGNVNSITAKTVHIEGVVHKENGATVSAYGFVWYKTLSPGQRDSLEVGKGKGEYESTITGLTEDTEYIIRAYAINSIGITYGEARSITTTTGLGEVRTLTPQSVKAEGAICGGRIISPGEGEIVKRGVYWATKPFEEAGDSFHEVPSTMVTDSFTCDLSGLLTPETVYYVKAFVTNKFGTFTGVQETFKTGNGLSRVGNLKRLSTGFTEVEMQAEVLDGGDKPITSRGFCYGLKDHIAELKIGKNGVDTIGCGDGTGVFSGFIRDLEPHHIYQVRAFSINEYGIVYSEEVEDVITRNNLPTVSTSNVIVNEGAGIVIASGVVQAEGETPVFASGFCWSTQPNPEIGGEGVNSITVSSGEGSLNAELTLRGEKTYYIRAFATNSSGSNYGDQIVKTMPSIFNTWASFGGTVRTPGSASYFVSNNKGFLIGGNTGNIQTKEVWEYSYQNDEWLPCANNPLERSWMAVAPYSKGVYVFGGLNEDNKPTRNFQYYDCQYNLWHGSEIVVPGGPDSLSHASGVHWGLCLYFLGGMNKTGIIGEVWEFQLTGQGQWVRKSDLPEPQYKAVSFVINDVLYAGLGQNSNPPVLSGNVRWWSSGDMANTWNEETAFPGKEVYGATVVGKSVYVLDDEGYIWVYDTETQLWTQQIRLPITDSNIYCMYYLNKRIYIGLRNSSNSLISYNLLWDNEE